MAEASLRTRQRLEEAHARLWKPEHLSSPKGMLIQALIWMKLRKVGASRRAPPALQPSKMSPRSTNSASPGFASCPLCGADCRACWQHGWLRVAYFAEMAFASDQFGSRLNLNWLMGTCWNRMNRWERTWMMWRIQIRSANRGEIPTRCRNGPGKTIPGKMMGKSDR